MHNLSKRIEELITDTGLSNAEFAERIDSSSATISHILNGRNKPSLQVVTQIKKAFTNVNLDYLLTGEGSLYAEAESPAEESSAGIALPSSFPMEGIRKVNVSGAPPKVSETAPDPQDSEVEKIVEKPDQSGSKRVDSEIEQVMVLYKDGRFKVYHP